MYVVMYSVHALWKLSSLDTLGTEEIVLISGVFLFQGLQCTQYGRFGTAERVCSF